MRRREYVKLKSGFFEKSNLLNWKNIKSETKEHGHGLNGKHKKAVSFFVWILLPIVFRVWHCNLIKKSISFDFLSLFFLSFSCFFFLSFTCRDNQRFISSLSSCDWFCPKCSLIFLLWKGTNYIEFPEGKALNERNLTELRGRRWIRSYFFFIRDVVQRMQCWIFLVFPMDDKHWILGILDDPS